MEQNQKITDQNTKPDFDWLSFFLLLGIIWISSWALAAADWADHLTLVTTMGSLGVVAGTALARSRFSPRVVIIFATVYGLFAIGWQLGLTLDPALIWQDKAQALVGRIGVFISVLFSDDPNRDSLMFVGVMGVLFWIFSVMGAWSLFRRGGLWMAVLPPGLTILSNAYFYLGRAPLSLYLAAYAALALLLFVRSDLARRQMVWKALRARVPSETSYRINRAGILTAFLLVGISWIGPAFSQYETATELWRAVSSPFRSAREWLGDAFGSLRGPLAVVPDYYGERLLLNAGIQPVDLPILDVDPEVLPALGGRFYWRSRVYDTYENGTWLTSFRSSTGLAPDEGDWTLPAYEGRQTIGVTITPTGAALASLYLPSQPIWVNRSVNVSITSEGGNPVDVTSVSASHVVMQGESYEARGSIAIPSADQLRAAGTEYPDWIITYYLQLPDSITPRIFALATEITRGRETPYDKAVAITTWLRQNIEYSRVIEVPPSGVDPIDWFLFDYRIGFCNYYASAEVIMLRSLGIPARVGAGYARGTYDAADGIFAVNADDSHSWPEIFFPGIGWVEFEPTVSQSILTRPAALADDTNNLSGREGGLTPSGPEEEFDPSEELIDPDEEISVFSLQEQRQTVLRRLLIAFTFVVIVIIIWLRVDPTSWATTRMFLARSLRGIGIEPPSLLLSHAADDLTPVGKIYSRWTIWLGRLGSPLEASQTPYERARAFATLLPDGAETGWRIVEAYVEERFGRLSVGVDTVRQDWRKLRPQLLFAWLWRKTARWRE
jgi:transglutaminase-like putative cysteine protease